MNVRKIIFFSLLVLLTIYIASVKNPPQNDRAWYSEFAKQTLIQDSEVGYQFQNIRNWKYQDAQLVSEDYISREYDPDKITQVWFLVEPFGKWDGVAHTYFTFDFEDTPPVSFSIEARRETGEEYSALYGLQNKYELIYMWGTEDDFLVRRAVYLGHDVYMYPLQVPDSWKKNWFLALIKETNELNSTPRYYNTIFSNCTNTLANMANAVRHGTIPWHYARVLTGFSDDYLYKLGYIPNNKSFEETKKEYYVSDVVRENYKKENFSEILRSTLVD